MRCHCIPFSLPVLRYLLLLSNREVNQSRTFQIQRKYNILLLLIITHFPIIKPILQLSKIYHSFIIKVFEQMYKRDRDVKLLLVGTGEDEEKIRQMVQEKKLTEKVIFYGVSQCVETLLCAMDCFIFPSHYEGLGIAALEAQASGLPVVASEQVPKEAGATELYKALSLSEDAAETWAETILAFKKKKTGRQLRYQELAEKGYDIKETAEKLKRMYLEA